MTRLIIKIYTLLCMLFLFGSCKTQHDIAGFWKGELAFSEYEVMTADLLLEDDSTFFFVKQASKNDPRKAYFGYWHLVEGKLFLDGGRDLQLFMTFENDAIEILDFEGEKVIGNKKFILAKTADSLMLSQEFLANGEYNYFADASTFRFCGSERLFPVAMLKDHLSAERMLLELHDNEPEALLYLQLLLSYEYLSGMDGGQTRQLIIHKVITQIPVCE